MTEIQIYCRRPSMGEMQALSGLGVELLGWDVRPDDAGALLLSRRLADQVRAAGSRSSLLVHSRKQDVLRLVASMVHPDYLLLSADRDDAMLSHLASAVAPYGTKLMVPVPIAPKGASIGIDSVALAQTYEDIAAYLTTDTCQAPADLSRFGCTGKVNDWAIARAVVAGVKVPVVMAGGLNPENVADAIREVQPQAVDACTSLELPDKSKDLSRCAEFVNAVRSAEEV